MSSLQFDAKFQQIESFVETVEVGQGVADHHGQGVGVKLTVQFREEFNGLRQGLFHHRTQVVREFNPGLHGKSRESIPASR